MYRVGMVPKGAKLSLWFCADALVAMEKAMKRDNIVVNDRQLACARITSLEGQDYLKGMAAAGNYAWVNRSSMTFLTRQVSSAPHTSYTLSHLARPHSSFTLDLHTRGKSDSIFFEDAGLHACVCKGASVHTSKVLQDLRNPKIAKQLHFQQLQYLLLSILCQLKTSVQISLRF